MLFSHHVWHSFAFSMGPSSCAIDLQNKKKVGLHKAFFNNLNQSIYEANLCHN